MNIKWLILFAFCLCTISAFAQNTHSVKGITIDTAAKSKVSSTVTILRPDSIMQAFGYAGNDGAFNIGGLPAGKYILLISFPEYADFSSPFTIAPTEAVHDFGNISMTLLSKILNEAVVKGSLNALKMRGDTSDFNAKAFVIQPNSKVDDLLKQIPGMQVDENGTIKFRGQTIKKMLVDGEEFFSDDPVLVSKTLRGDMIDRVRVYEKKSDQATFTGVDDGQRTQVIDLKLKEDKKVGMFGKLDGAGGRAEDGREMYAGQLQFNRFRANSKMSVYGTMANNGKVNLSYSDQSNLGSQNSALIGSDGSGVVMAIGGGGDELDNANYSGRGYPVAKTGGAHYDVKFGKGESINTNYRVGALNNTVLESTLQDRLINAQTSTRTATNAESMTNTFRQKLDVMYQKASLTSNLRIAVDGTLRNTDGNNSNRRYQTDQDGNFVNSTMQTNNRTGEAKLFNATMFYSQKFKKARRTLSWNVSENYSQSKEDLFAKTNVDNATTPDVVVDQYKPTRITSSLLSSNLTYTEPLAAKLTLTFNYLLGINNSISRRESYNKGGSGKYDQIDEITTNDYKYNVLTNQFGAIFSHVTTKTTATFGTRASNVNFNQADERRLTERNRNFINWLPQANFQFRPKQGRTFSLSYSGRTTQPSLDQIQPIVNNLDPTNLTIGNPDLKQSFSQSASAYFVTSSTLTGSSFYFTASYGMTDNAIINILNYANGVNTIQYVNLTDHKLHNFNLSTYISRKITSWDVNISPELSYSQQTNYSYTRDGNTNALNQSNNNYYTFYLSFSKSKTKKYSLSLSGSVGYQTTKNSFTTRNDYKSVQGSFSSSNTVYLPGNFEVFGSLRYTYNGPNSNTDLGAVHRANIDARISRSFLKGNNLKLSITGTNLLDQNPNIRNANGNYITQSTYNVIRRYFMLNLVWDFTKFGTMPANK